MKFKKILAGIVAAVVAVGSLSISAFADPGDTGTFDGFNYEELEDGTIKITKYVGDGGDVVIPAEIEGKKVTKIRDWAFQGSENLTSVEIPDTITEIGDTVFTFCPSLLSINVDKNNKYYASIDGVLFDKDISVIIFYPQGRQEAEYVIPDSVTKIGAEAFSYRGAYFPSGAKSIGESTLSNNDTYLTEENTTEPNTLVSVKIPNGVTEIGYCAFVFRNSLETVNIPDSVTYIDNGAFLQCESITSIDIPDSITHIGDSVFQSCVSLDSIEIPDSVTYIGEAAFRACESLTSFEMPDSVTYLGPYVFAGCYSLSSIKLSSSLTEIPHNAFQSCPFTSFEFPYGIVSVGSQVFRGCRSLESVVISDSVTSIGSQAFMYCYSLRTIEIPSSVTDIGFYAFGDCPDDMIIYGYAGSYAEKYAKENEINFVPFALTVKNKDSNIEIEGALPYDTVLTAEKSEETETSIAYDITLEDPNGDPIQPTTEVTVKIPVPESLSGADNYYVYYQIGDDLTDMNATYADGYVTFTTTHFSTYIISSVALSNDDTITTTADTTEPDATTGSGAGDTETGNEDEDKNMPTGVILLAIPALTAAAVVVISKKRR